MSHETAANRQRQDALPDDATVREAIRRSQRIASQLHQLIAASLTVAGLRDERNILESLADSTRRVFNADRAVITLDAGFGSPLRALAARGATTSSSQSERDDEFPLIQPGENTPWKDRNWLVAPILEGRGPARGVLAVERNDADFQTEDREVLALLAQMAGTALSSTELSRDIEASETRLRVLVDAAPAGIVEVDSEDRVRWWNRAAARIFGWPAFEQEDLGDGPHFPEDARAELATLFVDVVGSGLTGVRDLIEVNVRGRRRDLTASAVLLPNTDDTASILMLVDDVTDHRQLKAEVHHAQQMEIRGRVASSVAHDFNNLLTLISGYAEILIQELDPEDRSLEMVKGIQATASRASMLTAQLQAIGRSPSLEPVILKPVSVMQTNAEVFERVLGSDIDMAWALDDNAGAVRVDAGQFEQMMLNLAMNARDAMPDGGELRITIDVAHIDDSKAEHSTLPHGEYVRITVTDTGTGMSDDTLARCFETFFTTKGQFKGTGLGLASARRLVEECNGSITCSSTLGVGTTFQILLPAVDHVVSEEVTPAVIERAAGTATVLVAEDDNALRHLMVQVLSRNGYDVVATSSAEEALAQSTDLDRTIDLLVTDFVMKELSGAELAQALQAQRPTLRVLMTSGTANASIVDGLLPGTAAFLPKPFRPSALIDHVHDLLSRR